VFKEGAGELDHIVTQLINISIIYGNPPKQWKYALVTPVAKVTKIFYPYRKTRIVHVPFIS